MNPYMRARCMHFTEVNWILDDAVNQTLYSDFLLFHSKMMMRKSMVHWNFDAHDTLENMARCINLSDILGNGTWFFAVKYVHVHQWYSNRNCSPKLVQVGLLDNAGSDFPMKFLALNAVNTIDESIKIRHTHTHTPSKINKPAVMIPNVVALL